MEKHTTQKKFKCGICSKAFHRKDHLHRHKRIHGQPSNPPIRRPVASNAERIAPRGQRVRGAGAFVPTTRSRRATTTAATTRQRMTITKMSSAFQGACVSWRLEFPEIRINSDPFETDASHGANVQKLLEDAAGKMQNYILRYQRRREPIKLNMSIHLDFMQATDNSIVTFPPVVLVTDQQEVYQDTNVNKLLKTFAMQLGDRIMSYEGNGSGWVVDKLIWLDTTVWKLNPLRGDSFIPLPKWIQNTKSVVNVQNTEDNECFRHSVIASLYDGGHNKQRVSSYTRFYDENDAPLFDGLNYPLRITDITKFEKNNPKISVNVYGEVTTNSFSAAISTLSKIIEEEEKEEEEEGEEEEEEEEDQEEEEEEEEYE